MSIPDTIVWLANFPATHAYEMVFLGSFSAMGLIGLALRRGPSRSRLEQLRIERGLRDPDPSLGARIVAQTRSWSFVALALVVLAGLAIALASLLFGPITRGYIYDHGVRADTIVDDEGGSFETVTFDAENGTRYTLNLPFFSPRHLPRPRCDGHRNRPARRALPAGAPAGVRGRHPRVARFVGRTDRRMTGRRQMSVTPMCRSRSDTRRMSSSLGSSLSTFAIST